MKSTPPGKKEPQGDGHAAEGAGSAAALAEEEFYRDLGPIEMTGTVVGLVWFGMFLLLIGFDALGMQALGGAVMLLVQAVVYLCAGAWAQAAARLRRRVGADRCRAVLTGVGPEGQRPLFLPAIAAAILLAQAGLQYHSWSSFLEVRAHQTRELTRVREALERVRN